MIKITSNGLVEMTEQEKKEFDILTIQINAEIIKRDLIVSKFRLRNQYELDRQVSIEGIQVRDGGDRDNILEAISMSGKEWAPTEILWKLEDNTFRLVTKEDLEHILELYAQRKFALWETLQIALTNL